MSETYLTKENLDDAVKSALADAVTASLIEKLDVDALEKQVANCFRVAMDQQTALKEDPYRQSLQFLVGLLGFCLTLLTAYFASLLARSSGGEVVTYPTFADVLGYISLTALVATACIGIVQMMKSNYRQELKRVIHNANGENWDYPARSNPLLWGLTLLPVLPGALAARSAWLGTFGLGGG